MSTERLKTAKGNLTSIVVPVLELELVHRDEEKVRPKLNVLELGGYLLGGNAEFDQVLLLNHERKLHVELYSTYSALLSRPYVVGSTSISLKKGEPLPKVPEGYTWEETDPFDSVFELEPQRVSYVLVKEDPKLDDMYYSAEEIGGVARSAQEFENMARCFGALSESSPRH